ncbi:hydrocephalus-inducing protein homolog [Salvelinus alpinus]
MANQSSVSIVNRSDTIVHYQWKRFVTEQEEEQQKLRFCSELQQEEEDEMDQFLTECDADPTPHDRLSLLSRTFQDRRRQLKEERLSFSDNYIIVEPLVCYVEMGWRKDGGILLGCIMGPTFHFNVSELNFEDVSFGFPHTLTCSLNDTSL